MKIILTRHTTTSWNREKRIQGQTDIPLDEGGRREALEVGQKLAGFGIKQIISSDLLRARETAEIIASVIARPLVSTDRRLRECSFGLLEGMTLDQGLIAHGEGIKEHWHDQWQRYDFRPYGGEDRETVLKRHLEFLNEVRAQSNGMTLLVGHGRGMSTLLAGLGYPTELQRGSHRVVDY